MRTENKFKKKKGKKHKNTFTDEKKSHRNSNLFQHKSLNSFRLIFFAHSLSLSFFFSGERKNFFFLFIENETWTESNNNTNKDYLYKIIHEIPISCVLITNSEWILDFCFWCFWLNEIECRLVQIHEFGKKKNTTHHTAHKTGKEVTAARKDWYHHYFFFQLAIFISYRSTYRGIVDC